jgi:ABC-type multidrug transport system fused ATPase/permease subunit
MSDYLNSFCCTDAATAFTGLALFNVVRGPLEAISDTLVNVLQALVSCKRIDKLLQEEETAKYSIKPAPQPSDPVIGFRDATFTWASADGAETAGAENKFQLKNLNFSFPVGKLSIGMLI